jgi:hypothetical protein
MNSTRAAGPDIELPRRIRRPLAVVALVGYPAAVFCWTIGQTWLGLPPAIGGIAGLALILVTLFAMWRIYEFRSHLAQAPDAQLDERQVQIRDRAYLDSYRIFVGVTLVALVVAGLVPGILGRPLTLTFDVVNWFVMGGVLISLALPSAVVAWREPDLAD